MNNIQKQIDKSVNIINRFQFEIEITLHKLVDEQKVIQVLKEQPIIHFNKGKYVLVFGDASYNYEIADFLQEMTEEERNNHLIQIKIAKLKNEIEKLNSQIT